MPLRHVRLFSDPQLTKPLSVNENFGTVEVIDGVPVSKQIKVYASNDYRGDVLLTLEAAASGGVVGVSKPKQTIGSGKVAEFVIEVAADPKKDEPVRFNLKAVEEYIVGYG